MLESEIYNIYPLCYYIEHAFVKKDDISNLQMTFISQAQTCL